MKRIELILSQAVESDILEAFEEKKVGKAYTKIPNVIGKGFSDPKMGDSIWPQLNSLYIIYCEEEESQIIYDIVLKTREEYPCDGIAFFCT